VRLLYINHNLHIIKTIKAQTDSPCYTKYIMEGTFHKRNLPHLYFNDGRYFVTYNLANSIPSVKFFEFKNQIKGCGSVKFRRLLIKYDSLLNSEDSGIKYLCQKEIADVCKSTLHFPEGKEYNLICYCIMPNHIHVVFELLPVNRGISKIMQGIKGVSSNKSNILLGREGKFWQDESFDRWIRDDKELYFIVRYILLNPVYARLVDNWSDWQYTYCNPDFLVIENM
jgi:putative transposase